MISREDDIVCKFVVCISQIELRCHQLRLCVRVGNGIVVRDHYENQRLLLTVKLGSFRSRQGLFRPEEFWLTN